MSITEGLEHDAEPFLPDLTPDEMVTRARALRSRLVEEQRATEQRSRYSPEMHQEFLAAGFYHLYVPRRYGGLEYDVSTYARVIQEISRGCVSTGWGLGLCINHALQVASWWPQAYQDLLRPDEASPKLLRAPENRGVPGSSPGLAIAGIPCAGRSFRRWAPQQRHPARRAASRASSLRSSSAWTVASYRRVRCDCPTPRE